jgi:hypothetical protein
MALSRFQDIRAEIETRFDKDLLPAITARLRIPTEEIRHEIGRRGLPIHGNEIPLDTLDGSADALGRKTARKAMAVGAAGSVGGLVTMTPELAAGLIQHLRHAQRLAVVYGFDPQSELGNLLLWKALAVAYEVELPVQGLVGLHFRELGGLARETGEAHALTTLIRKLLLSSVKGLSRRPGRYVPGLGLGLSARASAKRSRSLHAAMKGVFREAWREAHASLGASTEVQEI